MAAGIGIPDFVGKTPQELYDELPVADSLESYLANEAFRAVYPTNWNVSVLIEIFKDAPVVKVPYGPSATLPPGILYSTLATSDHIIPTMLSIAGNSFGEVIVLGQQAIRLLQGDDGLWYLSFYKSMGSYVTHTAPWDDVTVYGGTWDEVFFKWYAQGDGTYGGLNNPPLLNITP